jgi:peptidyl-prolyl cis-trans isomerase SurA
VNKKIYLFFVFFLFFQINSVIANIYIKTIVDNELITNFDIKKENEYLKLLNPEINKLSENEINKIAKRSLINQKIKNKEIEKFYNDKKKNNDLVEEYYLNLISKLNFNSEEAFIKKLDYKKTYTIKEIKNKIEMELLWNELIYSKFINQVKVNKEKLIKRIQNKSQNTKNYFLSEIVFKKKKDQNLDKLFNEIILSINEIGFNNTANIYSVSDSAKFGGELGWVEENMLAKKIISEVKNLSEGQISQPIKIGNSFLIVKVNKINVIEVSVDEKKELEKLINNETNIQLNQFSKIYFDKIKMNYNINEK